MPLNAWEVTNKIYSLVFGQSHMRANFIGSGQKCTEDVSWHFICDRNKFQLTFKVCCVHINNKV